MDDALFSVIDEVIAPGDTQIAASHVVDYEVQKLLSQGWQGYIRILQERVPDMPAPVVRQITTAFEAECHAGDRLQRGARAVSRSRRSYVIEEALWYPDSKKVVATSKVVMMGIDRATGRAAEISPALLAALEELEGGPIPLSERA
jgi:acyl-CoA thioesterase FadM